MVHCAPVYSELIHAKIKSINTSKAEKAKGVLRVITAKDVPGNANFGQIHKDYFMFVTEKIRSEGDVVALIVADTRENAISATNLVEVDAIPLPILSDMEAAFNEKENLVHESKGSNIINHHKIRRGKKIDIAFSECDVILEREYSTGYIEHAYLEPESAVCVPRYDGVMEVYGSMQHPFSTRRFVATLLGKQLSEIEIIATTMGGGFGGKDDTAAIVCARAALAAQLTGKPAKLTYTREWSMRESYKRHPYKLHYKIGVKGKKIHAVKTKMIVDGGAYTSVTPWVSWRSTVQCCGPYKVENVICDAYGVHTNNIFTGAFRGFGAPQVNFCIEQLVEECAKEIGEDPIAFRKENMLRQGDETITSQKLDNHTVSTEEVLNKVLEISDYSNKIKNISLGKKSEKQYGIGVAMSYRGASLGAEGMDFCSAIINGQFDGSILLEVGIHENGQGAESAMILLAAENLGIKKERIRYNRASTSHIPDGGTTVASRGTLMGGGAVVDAAKNLKRIIAKSLHKELNCKIEDVRFFDNFVWGATNENKISWKDAMHKMFLNCDYPFSFGSFKAPKVSWDEENGTGNAYFTWVYSAQVIELEFDTIKNSVKLLDIFAVHDIGKTVNKKMLQGQIYGGITQGVGMALMENLTSTNGKLSATNFNKYKIPRATDIPKITTAIVENHDPNSPTGAKGIGEPALEIAAAAIGNAMYNATGKRFNSYPIKFKK